VREWAVLVPVVIMIVWLGVFPRTFLDKSAVAARGIVHRIEEARRGTAMPPLIDHLRNAREEQR
jgi:NADH:ubiquinone oxidoreductase subunit 4 (subunit M)